MAEQEHVQSFMKDLEVAQGDFNENPSNPHLMRKFIEAANKTAVDLKKNFPDFWKKPGYKPTGWEKDLE